MSLTGGLGMLGFFTIYSKAQTSRSDMTDILLNGSFGSAGYRSRYLSHAKRALYHLSYAPDGEAGNLFAIYFVLYDNVAPKLLHV